MKRLVNFAKRVSAAWLAAPFARVLVEKGYLL